MLFDAQAGVARSERGPAQNLRSGGIAMKRSSGIRCAVVSAVVIGAATAQADDRSVEGTFVVGQSGRVEAGQEVEAAIVVGGNLVVEGRVSRIAAVVGGDLEVRPGAVVEGSIAAIGGTLRVDERARVDGARVHVAGGDFSAVVRDLSEGRDTQMVPPRWVRPVMRLFQMLALFVIGVFLVLLAPRQVQAVRQTVREHVAMATLVGLALLVGFVPLCILLAISLFGIPLIPVAALVLLAAIIMGLTGIAAAIGYATPPIKDPDNLFGAMALGVLLLALVSAIPVLGALVLFSASFYGAGAALLSRFGTRVPPAREASPKVAPEGAPHANAQATAQH
jgi:hypothetical protein